MAATDPIQATIELRETSARSRNIQILSVVAAFVVGVIATIEAADGVIDAPWLAILSGVFYFARRLVQMLEPIVGADLDGDGRTGPLERTGPHRSVRSPVVVGLVAIAIAVLLTACGGAQHPVALHSLTLTGDVCAGGDLVWDADGIQGDWATGGTGVVRADLDTPVGPAALELRTYGEGEPGYVGGALEVCAEWGPLVECRVIVDAGD